MEEIKLNTTSYIDSLNGNPLKKPFTELGLSTPKAPTPSIDEFFRLYNNLSYQMPKTGPNSHETLVNLSREFSSLPQQSDEIQQLTDYLNSLSKDLTEAQTEIVELTQENGDLRTKLNEDDDSEKRSLIQRIFNRNA